MSADIIPFRKPAAPRPVAIDKPHRDWMQRQREQLGWKRPVSPEPPEAA